MEALLGVAIRPSPTRSGRDGTRRMRMDGLKTLEALVPHILQVLLPLLSPTTLPRLRMRASGVQKRARGTVLAAQAEIADEFISEVGEKIIARSVAVFAELSVSVIWDTLRESSTNFDARPGLLNILSMIVHLLDEWASNAGESGSTARATVLATKERMLLSVMDAFEALYTSEPSQGESGNTIQYRLARKDTTWYLCTLLRVCLPSALASEPSLSTPFAPLFREHMLRRLGALVRRATPSLSGPPAARPPQPSEAQRESGPLTSAAGAADLGGTEAFDAMRPSPLSAEKNRARSRRVREAAGAAGRCGEADEESYERREFEAPGRAPAGREPSSEGGAVEMGPVERSMLLAVVESAFGWAGSVA